MNHGIPGNRKFKKEGKSQIRKKKRGCRIVWNRDSEGKSWEEGGGGQGVE